MGIVTENREWAAHADRHGEKMFRQTKNPYYVVVAIAAARLVGWKPPEWALGPLLDAVKNAYFKSQNASKDVSIDAALGLKIGRGATPPRLSALKAELEAVAFDDVTLIRACFDMPVPSACELVYWEPDFNFARGMSEIISGRWTVTDQDLAVMEMTRDQLEGVIEKQLEREAVLVGDPSHSRVVREKLQKLDFFSITTGERLGYSVDTFIEKYYRRVQPVGMPEDDGRLELSKYLNGMILLNSHTCRRSCCGDVPAEMHGRNPLSGISPRAGFADFQARHRSVFK